MASRVRGTYPLAVAVVLLGLCPDLVLSTGSVPLNQALMTALGASMTQLQVVGGLSSAAFATGVVLAAMLPAMPTATAVPGVHVRPGVVDDDAYDLVPTRLRRRRWG